MKIQDLVSEAISYTKHKPDIIDAISHDIAHAAKVTKQWLTSSKTKKDPDEIKQLSNPDQFGSYDFFDTLKHKFNLILKKSLSKGKLFDLASDKIDSQLEFVLFEPQETSSGQAGWNYVSLNNEFLEEIADVAHEFFISEFSNNDSINSLKLGVEAFERSASKKNYRPLNQIIKKMSDVFVHEMVHITQHSRQKHREKIKTLYPPTEYRSYLDKKKGEFHGLSKQKNGDQHNRWSELYSASPQEMAAFAHNIVLKLIDNYSLEIQPELTRGENLEDLKYNTDLAFKYIPKYVKDHISRFTDTDFSASDNPRARKVYHRYVRLVFQELQRYVHHLIEKLKD